jgi:uncharacterized protein YfbU (UPF0304 family)
MNSHYAGLVYAQGSHIINFLRFMIQKVQCILIYSTCYKFVFLILSVYTQRYRKMSTGIHA